MFRLEYANHALIVLQILVKCARIFDTYNQAKYFQIFSIVPDASAHCPILKEIGEASQLPQ